MLLTDVMFANSSGQTIIDDFQDQVGDRDPILRQIGKDEAPSRDYVLLRDIAEVSITEGPNQISREIASRWN